MWHEARRQERKIRKAIVDYKKRSERRHQYYERIKQDPTKFLQVHGRKSKIHLDGTVAAEADNNNHMMPWLGDNSNLIDRFDVRTHLDYIPDVNNANEEAVTSEERKCNFERYRVLIWNEYKKIPEQQHLKQINIDEQFTEMSSQQKQMENQKHLLAHSKAKIGYDYDENDRSWNRNKANSQYSNRGKPADDFSDEDDDDFDIMEELEEIPPLSEISMDAITAMDEIGAKKYRLTRGSFGDCLVDDQNHMDKVSAAKDMESERRRFSGRKSRRERRLLKDERLKGREIGVLSYVRQQSSGSSQSSDSESSNSSDSSSSEDSDRDVASNSKPRIEYITSFGEDTGTKGTPSKRAKISSKKSKRSKSRSPRRRRSRTRSPIRHTKYSGYSRRRSRSRSRDRSRDDRRDRRRDRRSRSSSSSDDSYSKEHRKTKYSGSNRGERTAKIMPSRQSTDSLIKSLSKHGSAEEKAAAIKKLTPQQKLKIKMQRALNKQLKVDRHAVMEKKIEKQQKIIEREDDLREISRKIRKREGGYEDGSTVFKNVLRNARQIRERLCEGRVGRKPKDHD